MLVLRIVQVGLEFLCGLALARLLGASSYGAYAFALSWVGLLGIPVALGFDRLLIREIAKFRARAEWAFMRGILRRSSQFVILTSIAVAGAAAAGSYVLTAEPGSEMGVTLRVALIIVPLIAVARLRQAALQGLGHVVQGQLPESLVQPGVLLCLLGAVYIAADAPHTGLMAVILQVAAVAAACAWGHWLLRRSLPAGVKIAKPEYRTGAWLLAAGPFLWILGMNVVVTYTDVIMLGLLVGSEPAGVYRVASQMAAFVAFPLTAVNMAFAPAIASLYIRNDLSVLQQKATISAQAILAMALPIAAILILFGRPILALFGTEFVAGYSALAILVGGYLVNAAMGTSGYLLIMTRHERAAAVTFSCSAAINVIGCLLFIPAWGVEGAALATALSVIAVSMIFAVVAYRKLGIQPTAFPSVRSSTVGTHL